MNRPWSSLPDLRVLAAARGTQQNFISANDHDRAWSSLPDLHPDSNDASNSYSFNTDSTYAFPEITEKLGIPGAYKFLDDEAQRPSQADIAVGNDLKEEALTNVNTEISLAIECAVRAYQPEVPITLRHPGRPGVAAPKVVDDLTQSSSDDAQVSRIALFEHQHAEASSSHSETEAKVTLSVAVVGLDLPEDLKEEHIFNAVDGRSGAEMKTFQPVDIIESPLLHPRGQPMLVHRRFMGAAAKIVDRVASLIRSACSDADTPTALLVTGHSSGGAIASLVLRLLWNQYAILMSKFAGQVRLVTFGSPPVIASHHEHLFKPAEARCQAFMAQGDAVTLVRLVYDWQLALPHIKALVRVLPKIHDPSRLAQTVVCCPVGQLVKIEQDDLFESTLRQVDLRSWSSMTPPDPWHPQSHSIVSYWLLIQSLDTSRWTPRASALFSEASPLSSDALRVDPPDVCGTSALSQLQSVNADKDLAILYVDIAKLHPVHPLSGSSVRIPSDVLTWFGEEGIAKTISAFELRHLACVQAAVLPVTYNPVSARLGSPCIYLYGNAASKEHRDFAKWLTTSGFPVLLWSYPLAPPDMLTTAMSTAPTVSCPAGTRVYHTGGETTSTAVSTLELDRGDLAPQQCLLVGPCAPSDTCPLRPQLCGPSALQSKQIFQFQGILGDGLTKQVKYKWVHMLTVIPGL
ncbi:hypothetical protein IE81DRAFT_56380 [Ceraceosorus guamensis]|uniref:Fungal lipase-type domain-containing protein n=1 Tax=Ceraceosorus guamensis TaxID=1522189 RepID=A0A316VPQ3_9BASI|nr:hypothetical protein IE81DRAFT_56380 [Ceraceosorus guamensis]PWN39058.1 hypothetical protein IE81DRAFT_56380 [Ceraceosorus guamensis]